MTNSSSFATIKLVEKRYHKKRIISGCCTWTSSQSSVPYEKSESTSLDKQKFQ